jgi:hypothetical protein
MNIGFSFAEKLAEGGRVRCDEVLYGSGGVMNGGKFGINRWTGV